MFAEVIVDISNSEVDKIFEYSFSTADIKEGSRVSVPFANKKIEGIVIGIKEKCKYDERKVKPIISVLDSTPALTEECLKLVFFIKEKYHIPTALALRLFLPTEMRKGKVKKQFESFVSLGENVSPLVAASSISDRATAQKKALGFVVEAKTVNLTELNLKFGNSAVRALIEKGILKITKTAKNRSPYNDLDNRNKTVSLTAAQSKAVDIVENGEKRTNLLFGVTGSGKTEVYLRLIKNTIEKGKSAIMLVPEIALTPQMLSQLRARFSDSAAILHSGLSAGEKFDEWWRLREKEAVIAIGARSAIFAPVENIGLIIIDEEHDGSYSSDTSPRYNTVEIAAFRQRYNDGCKLVLGSATPSIESYVLAKKGEYGLITLPDRINKKPLPEMLITDMRRQIRRGNNTVFSSTLKDELKTCLEGGNQAIIFLNRRGFSQNVICQECGYVAKCDACDVSLNYHLDGNVLKCHYCNATYKMPEACPECGSKYIRYGGTGTERVVIELKKLFPDAEIIRMDNDTTRSKDAHLKIIKEFSSGKADILVGTQMIAKGHDFPNVTLVGILDADMSLYFSDYRSRERTFQLLTQVSGRCGRADKKGTVVLQTFSPEHPVLSYAASYDYTGFIESEIALRKSTFYPPFATILRVMISDEVDNTAMETLRNVFFELEEIYKSNREKFIFFNKMKSPIKRMNGKYRYQVMMRIRPENEKLIDKIYEASLKYKTKSTLVYVEENPNNLT